MLIIIKDPTCDLDIIPTMHFDLFGKHNFYPIENHLYRSFKP